MKPKNLEALLYNREAYLKSKLEKEWNSKTAHRLEEVKYLKQQVVAMLREVKYEYRSYP